MLWAPTTLLFTTLLCALGVAQASAQNAVSQQLLELDDAKRNAAFTIMLNESIDDVIKSCELSLVVACWAWTNGKPRATIKMPTLLASFQNRTRQSSHR